MPRGRVSKGTQGQLYTLRNVTDSLNRAPQRVQR